MQLGTTPTEARDLWAAMPPLGSTTALGVGPARGQRPRRDGGAGGAPRPLVAVQRYGYGRTMVFAGEASWRWRMMLPSTNHTFETFWRQAGRWLAVAAPEPVALSARRCRVGETATLGVDVRDAGFRPLPDATVRLRVTRRGGATQELQACPTRRVAGRFLRRCPPNSPASSALDVEARRGGGAHRARRTTGRSSAASIASSADPRRNDDVLDRLARETGGGCVADAEMPQLPALLAAAAAAAGALRPRSGSCGIRRGLPAAG